MDRPVKFLLFYSMLSEKAKRRFRDEVRILLHEQGVSDKAVLNAPGAMLKAVTTHASVPDL